MYLEHYGRKLEDELSWSGVQQKLIRGEVITEVSGYIKLPNVLVWNVISGHAQCVSSPTKTTRANTIFMFALLNSITTNLDKITT